MKIYIIWETKENRPIIAREGFGKIYAHTSKMHADADLKDLKMFEENCHYELREFELAI